MYYSGAENGSPVGIATYSRSKYVIDHYGKYYVPVDHIKGNVTVINGKPASASKP